MEIYELKCILLLQLYSIIKHTVKYIINILVTKKDVHCEFGILNNLIKYIFLVGRIEGSLCSVNKKVSKVIFEGNLECIHLHNITIKPGLLNSSDKVIERRMCYTRRRCLFHSF